MIRDDNLALRRASDGAFDSDATATLTAFDLRGSPISGLGLQIVCPAATGTSPTLDIFIHASASSAPDSTESIATHPTITASGVYFMPFATDKRYIEVLLTLGGTAADFGSVEVYIVDNYGFVHDRGVDFAA